MKLHHRRRNGNSALGSIFFEAMRKIKNSIEIKRKGLIYGKFGVNCRDRGLYRDVLSTGLYRVIR